MSRRRFMMKKQNVIDVHTYLLFRVVGSILKDVVGKHDITYNNTTVSTSIKKFNASFLLSNNKYLIFNKMSTLNINGEWTIDFWEYSNGASDYGALLMNRKYPYGDIGGTGVVMGYQGVNYLAGTGNWGNNTKIKDKPNYIWVHWAIVKSGNSITSYKNGLKFAQFTSSTIGAIDNNNYYTIGVWDHSASGYGNNYNAYIEEFRISDIARWASNFTPPTQPY